MGAEIPRYKREALLWIDLVSLGTNADGQDRAERLKNPRKHIPLMLDDLAEAVEHAIVVLGAGNRSTTLKLTVGRGVSHCGVIRVTLSDREIGDRAYTRVLTTSNGYLQESHSQYQLLPESIVGSGCRGRVAIEVERNWRVHHQDLVPCGDTD